MPALRIQLNSLTGLRFFAAVAVVLYHLRIYFPPVGDFLGIFRNGFTGVSFFFVLSGFVLTWSHRSDVGPRRFYWHRFARIWPLHVLTMFVAVLVPSFSFAAHSGWAAAPFALTLTQAWMPASPFLYSFNTVSWSLSCEVFFYLVFPLLFKVLARCVRVARIAGAVVAGLAVSTFWLSMYASIPVADYLLATMPLYRLGEFVLGMCLAVAMKRGWRPKFQFGPAVGMTALLAVGLFLAPLTLNGRSDSVPVIIANLVMMPGFVALIAASADRDLSRNTTFLDSTTLVRLGRWSFALYLVHELVFKLTKPFLADIQVGATFAVAALSVLVCIALSGVLHEFVERPAEKWLRSRGTRLPASSPKVAKVHHPEK